MRKSFRGKRTKPTSSYKEFRINDKIFAQEMTVIDEKGESLGTITKEKALTLAQERELDLVEVSPKVDPPICKLMDYGSFKYQREKAERKQKSKTKTTEIKTVKISARISEHDMEVRIKNAAKFLSEGDKVKIELQLRGRENQHTDLAKENMKKMIKKIEEKLEDKNLKIEQEIKKQGGRLSTVVSV